MNEERMDMVVEEDWEETRDCGERAEVEMNEVLPLDEDEGYGGCEGDEGGAGAADGPDGQQDKSDVMPPLPEGQTGVGGKEHPLLTRIRENARRQDMERFVAAYPHVKGEEIPREVWEQVHKGVPLTSAYAMYENQQLKMQLAAQRQDALNRRRTPGALGANLGGELDEMDRMWAEED